jgi:hypothetical protein
MRITKLVVIDDKGVEYVWEGAGSALVHNTTQKDSEGKRSSELRFITAQIVPSS